MHYDLVLNGKLYPPKYVISLATKYATCTEHPADSFNAVEAKNYFVARNYEVIDRRIEAASIIVSEDDESAFPEGKARFAQHRTLERDSSITRKAKANRLTDTQQARMRCLLFRFLQILTENSVRGSSKHITSFR